MKTRLALLAIMMTTLGASSVAHAGSNPWRTDATPSASLKPTTPEAFSSFKFAPDARSGAPMVQAAPATPYWQLPQQRPLGNGLPYGGYPNGNPGGAFGGYPGGGYPGSNGLMSPNNIPSMPYGLSGGNGMFSGNNNNLNGLTGPMTWFPFW